MVSEPVDASSALFGADGTALPDPLPVLPDPLTGPVRGTWLDAPTIPPVPLPAMPDARAMREAVLAELGEDPAGPPASQSPRVDTSTSETRPILQSGAHPQAASPYQRPPPRPGGQAPMRGPAAPGPHHPGVSGPPRALSPVPPADLRRRISRELPAGVPTRSAGGVRTGCVIALIFFGVVAFTIIAGLVQSVSVLLP